MRAFVESLLILLAGLAILAACAALWELAILRLG